MRDWSLLGSLGPGFRRLSPGSPLPLLFCLYPFCTISFSWEYNLHVSYLTSSRVSLGIWGLKHIINTVSAPILNPLNCSIFLSAISFGIIFLSLFKFLPSFLSPSSFSLFLLARLLYTKLPWCPHLPSAGNYRYAVPWSSLKLLFLETLVCRSLVDCAADGDFCLWHLCSGSVLSVLYCGIAPCLVKSALLVVIARQLLCSTVK